jgi:hypothetical protein
MTQPELKKNILSLIDEIDDPKLLYYLYEFVTLLKLNDKDSKDDWWNKLTDEQKADIDLAIEESNDPSKLTPHEQVMKDSRDWIKKRNSQNSDANRENR